MLSPAALDLVDRLVTALMTLVAAVAPGAKRDTAPTLPEAAAQSLFFRLARLATHLIRISNFGIRTSPKPKPTPQRPNDPPPAARPPRPTQPGAPTFLPRRPGWLLTALPDIAPSVAADISALLAAPALAALLDRAPSLHRTLRPLLRSLGLDAVPPRPPPPRPTSPTTSHATQPALPPTIKQTDPPHPAKTRPPEHQISSRLIHYGIAMICQRIGASGGAPHATSRPSHISAARSAKREAALRSCSTAIVVSPRRTATTCPSRRRRGSPAPRRAAPPT